jgi:hypothetical protein
MTQYIWSRCTLLMTAFTVLLLQGCNNDLVTVDTYKEIPVVYGFVSLQDTATYIRVERAFIDPVVPAATLAKNADSLYYKNIVVELVRQRDARRFTLTAVDATKEGYPRDSGFFATTPNTVYKILNSNLLPLENDSVQVVVRKVGATKSLTEAKTAVIGNYVFLESLPQYDAPYINMNATSEITVGFQSRTETASKFYNCSIYVNYNELIGGQTTRKRIEWKFVQNQKRNRQGGVLDPSIYLSRSGTDFLRFLKENIAVNSAAVRQITTLDIRVDCGSSELLAYSSIVNANSGITGSQSIPTYTNMSNGAYGIFTSRNALAKNGFQLGTGALTFIQNNDLTKNLNFR